MDRPGLWIVLASLGVVLVFVGFLLLTADPGAPAEARAAGTRGADVLAQASRNAWSAGEGALATWRARHGL